MGTILRLTKDGPYREWENVEKTTYEGETVYAGATKQVLINKATGAPNFGVRYFTIPPHGKSNLDHHVHDHGVVIMDGEGRLLLGEEYHDIKAGDVIYIEGWEVHQFESTTDEPLTFMCVVPPRPVQPTDAEVEDQPSELSAEPN